MILIKEPKGKIKKRSIKLYGHKTSISIEDEFWFFLKRFADENQISIYKLVEKIDGGQNEKNLSSSIRLFCFELTLKSYPTVESQGK